MKLVINIALAIIAFLLFSTLIVKKPAGATSPLHAEQMRLQAIIDDSDDVDVFSER